MLAHPDSKKCSDQISCISVCAFWLLSLRRLWLLSHQEESDSSFFSPHHQVFIWIDKMSLRLPFSRLNISISQPSCVCQMLQSLCGSFLDFSHYVPVCLVLGRPELDQALHICLTRAEQRQRLWFCWSLLHIAGSYSTYCPLEQWSKVVFYPPVPNVLVHGIIPPQGQDFLFLCFLYNFMRFLLVHSTDCWIPFKW